MSKPTALFAILAITSSAPAAILDYEQEGTGSIAKTQLNVYAKTPSRYSVGVNLFYESGYVGTTTTDGWKIHTQGVQSVADGNTSDSRTSEFWSGDAFEEFTLTLTTDQDVITTISGYQDAIIPRPSTAELGTVPASGEDYTVSISDIAFTWQLQGPRSAISGEGVYVYGNTNSIQSWKLTPEDIPFLDTRWNGNHPFVSLGTFELDGATFELEVVGSNVGRLVPEPTTGVLMGVGLLGFIGRVRRHH